MIRQIIRIDKEKCDGCELCVAACHEGAIGLIDGKATLLRDDYCDGLGDCLPACPQEAISFERREAADYDEAAVMVNLQKITTGHTDGDYGSGSHDHTSSGGDHPHPTDLDEPAHMHEPEQLAPSAPGTHLNNWPVQIKLVSTRASFYQNANLLIAADCSAYAYGNFHSEFMKNRVTLIGCPKLDGIDYTDKLTEIITSNDIASITVTRMEVPCCSGIEAAVKTAIANSGKSIPQQVIIFTTDGKQKN
ncbi:MAG: 4Fe-4S dicluster domain-containing protein [Coriobacteriia bacterium]|nr:4Fe-4S dicluster domain-containing protein [Coriobacteriia bacterium]